MNTRQNVRYRSIIALTALLLVALAACSGHGSAGASSPTPPPTQTPQPPTVSSVTLSGGTTLALAPSGTTSLTAQAQDASGNPISTTFTWASSDSSIATVADGTVSAVAVGQAAITAKATNGVVSNTYTVVVNPSGSSEDALTAAVNSGDITPEQAVVYQVFSLFKDPRLPVRFIATSDQPENSHDLIMADIAAHFDSLSLDAQNQVGPYLVPPAYWQNSTNAGSSRTRMHQSLRAGQVKAGTSSTEGFCLYTLSTHWASVDSANFRVWYDATANPKWATVAADVSAMAETSLSTFYGLGFNKPLDDSSWLCDGGDGRLDIYLQEIGSNINGLTHPINLGTGLGSTTPAFIIIDPNVAYISTVSHELMHAIQFSYPNLGTSSYRWVQEAVAEWARSLPPPNDHVHQLAVLTHSLRDADMPLFYPNAYCSSSGAALASFLGFGCDTQRSNSDFKMYSSYVFFQYMAQQSGGPILVSAFLGNAATSTDPLDAINATLGGSRALVDFWPKFSEALWNQGPDSGTFPEWDGEMFWNAAKGHPVISIGSSNDLPRKIQLPTLDPTGAGQQTTVNELSAIYDEFTFSGDVSSVVFYNGFSQRLTTKPFTLKESVSNSASVNLDLGNVYATYQATDDQIRGRHVTALKLIDGTWSSEDWSQAPYIALCLDKAAQRIDRLVLIFSNGNYTTSRADDMTSGAIDSIGDQTSTLVASGTPCWQYQGTYKTSLDVDQNGDTFSIDTTTTATYIGKADERTANFADGSAVVFFGWLFAADPPSLTFNATAKGTIHTCNNLSLNASQNTPLNYQPGFRIWALPASSSPYTELSGGSWYNGGDADGGAGTALQFTIDPCTSGTTKRLPAVNPLSFNLSPDGVSTPLRLGVDAINNRLESGQSGIPSAPWDNGDYSVDSSHPVTNTWCLIGLRENEVALSCP